MMPGLPPGLLNPDADREEAEELTPEQEAEKEARQREADQFAAHAADQSWRPTWKKIGGNPTPGEEADESRNSLGNIHAGEGAPKKGKLDYGLYVNELTGDHIRYKKDGSIKILGEYKKYENSSHYKSGGIFSDKDFMKKFGAGVDFMKTDMKAQSIFLDIGPEFITASRIKKLLDHAAKEPPSDIEFSEDMEDYIDQLPNKEKKAIYEQQEGLAKHAKLYRILKGHDQEAEAFAEHTDQLTNLPATVPNAAALQDPTLAPGAPAMAQELDSVAKVEAELDKIDAQLKEVRRAGAEMKSSLDTYDQIYNTRADDLIKTPLKDHSLGDDPVKVFDQALNANRTSEPERANLLVAMQTKTAALEASHAACKAQLNTLKATLPVPPAPPPGGGAAPPPPALTAQQTELKQKIDNLEARTTKTDAEITAVKKLKTDNQTAHDALPNQMKEKAKEVKVAVRAQAPKPT